MISQKKQILHEFLEKHKDLPEQGTPEWLAIRGIGGSELDLLLKNEKLLVAQKAGLEKMVDNICMRWGNLFEDTLRDITARIVKCNIYEASSIPSVEVAGKTFSMDGLGIVNFLMTHWDNIPARYRMPLLTLFEFKCPFSRDIKIGEIYKSYIPQVKSGMSDLGIPEIALYIEGVFRICRYEELGMNTFYETWLHKEEKMPEPLVCGFLGFYMDDFLIPDNANYVEDWLQSGQVDFAKIDNKNKLNTLLGLCRNKIVHVYHSECSISAELQNNEFIKAQSFKVLEKEIDYDNELLKFYKKCRVENKQSLGILGFKLFKYNIVPIEKEDHYTKRFENEITSAIQKIKMLNSIDDIADRQMAYDRMYGIVSEINDDIDELMSYF